MFNWVDIVLLAGTGYYLFEGWQIGFFELLIDLGSFIGSLWLALRFHGVLGEFLETRFALPLLWTNIVSYVVIGYLGQLILFSFGRRILERIPKKIAEQKTYRGLGALVSALNFLVLVTFFLVLIMALPLRGLVKTDISQSKIGSILLTGADRWGGGMTSSIQEIEEAAVKFITVEQGSRETVSLTTIPASLPLSLDSAGEEHMIDLVNGERQKYGKPILSADSRMRDVARAYSRRMFEERFFSHFDPQGKNAGDRVGAAGITYAYLGENLAYAPDVATAHSGLMQREGHKRNILDERFRRIGIGIVKSEAYGIMVTQLFAD